MRLKMSISSSPVIGFAISQLKNSLFAGLIFTIVTVAAAFGMGYNNFYGMVIRDIAISNNEFAGFAAIIAAIAFVFAAYIFKPFMSKNERDTILSLPIKKTHMISTQVIFGLIIIVASTVLSFALFYPAMNLNRFNGAGAYHDAIMSMLTGIILPICIYYTLSVVLILRTRNFLSSAALLAGICVCAFYTNSYISLHSGMSAVGADISEISSVVQPFYRSTDILIPASFISTMLKLAFSLKVSMISTSALIVIVNIAIFAICAVLVVFAAKAVYLGEINRPLALVPFIKTLPCAVLIAICPLLMSFDLKINIFLIAAAAFAIAAVCIFIFSRNIKKSVIRSVACMMIIFIPAFSTYADAGLSRSITFDVPDISDVEAVYFNPINPISIYEYNDGAFRNCSMTEMRAGTRYKFESKDAIQRIIKLHQTIVDKIDENNLMNIEYLKTDDNMVVANSGALQFFYDEYATDMSDDSLTVLNEDKTWDLFNNQQEEEVPVIADSSLDITPNTYINVSGTDSTDIDTSTQYNATFYYKLRDGRMFCRSYKPLPVSWVRTDMLSILSCEEYKQKETKYIKNLADTNYTDEYTTLNYGEGYFENKYLPERTFLNGKEQMLELVLALYEDEWNYTNAQIASQEIVYTIRSDAFSIIDLSNKQIYVRSGYTKTIEFIKKMIEQQGDENNETQQETNSWGNNDWSDGNDWSKWNDWSGWKDDWAR